MISREPTLERLATAQQLMLEPFGLNEATLSQALALIGEHRVDDADLYFQTTRHEGWSLEEGIVKSGSFSIDQGVGVRAVAGEKTAFAYSDDLSTEALMDAARTVRTIAAAGQNRRIKLARAPKVAKSRLLYAPTDPIGTLDSTQKVALLEKVEKLARAKDPRVVQVMASVGAEYDVVLVARADGTRAADVRPLVRLNVTVIAEQTVAGELRREVGSGGGGGRFGLGYFSDAVIAQYVDHAVGAALTNLESRPVPAERSRLAASPTLKRVQNDAPGAESTGVHAAAGDTGAAAETAPDPVLRGAGAQREAAGASGAAGAGCSGARGHRRSGARRVRTGHPPWAGSPAAAPGTGERGGPRVRRRLRSARHPGRAPWAGARAPQSGWRLRTVPASGCVYARMRSKGRLRVVQPPALGACFPLPGLVRAFEIPIPATGAPSFLTGAWASARPETDRSGPWSAAARPPPRCARCPAPRTGPGARRQRPFAGPPGGTSRRDVRR